MGRHENSGTRADLTVAGVLLASGLLLGALGGVVWQWLWTPPVGMVRDETWYFTPEGAEVEAAGVVLFTAIGAVLGLALGALAVVVSRGRELLGLVSVTLSALIASAVMRATGQWLGPADPAVLAKEAPDGTPLPAELTLRAPELGDTTLAWMHPGMLVPAFVALVVLVLTWLLSKPRRRAATE